MNSQAFYLLRFLAVIKYMQEDLGLKFLVLKGPVYAAYFPNYTQYSKYTDLDIYPLEDKRNFARKLKISGRFYPQIDPEQPNFLVIDEVQWVDLETGLILDVHTGVFEPYLGKKGRTIDETLIEIKAEVKVQHITINSLPKVYLLLHLMLHGEKHYWQFQKDIDLTLKFLGLVETNFQNGNLNRLVKKHNLDKIFYFSLQFLHGKEIKSNYCYRHLLKLRVNKYPKSMFQMWRPSNMYYHFKVSATMGMFLRRWFSGLLPILPLSVRCYPNSSPIKLKIIHFLRLLGFVQRYPDDEEWRLHIRKFYNV